MLHLHKQLILIAFRLVEILNYIVFVLIIILLTSINCLIVAFLVLDVIFQILKQIPNLD